MKTRISGASMRLSAICLAIAASTVSYHTLAQDVPPGFHVMPDGRIMANNPATAIAPPGYHLMPDGTLMENNPQPKLKPASADSIPPGFHRMPDGTIMANNPATAVAPPGYHLMPDGTLMANSGGSQSAEPEEVPPGFHRMPDGTIMANNPSTAVPPPGYHLMPDGTLMAGGGGGEHSHHHHHGAGGHGAGMWMFDYKFTRMYMEGLLDTTTEKSADDMFAAPYNYMMAPTDMTMNMHMLMGMYGITDKVMIMLMGHYMSNEMGMVSSDGTKSVMKSSGIADTVVSFMIQGPAKLTFNIGLSIPTGDIDIKGPMTHAAGVVQNDAKYPYGMQMGSGTYDLKPGISYADSADMFSWGADFEYTYRIGKNDNDYKLGNQLLLGGWAGITPAPYFSAKAKLNLKSWGQIEGEDSELNKTMSPPQDASNYGGTRLDAGGEIKLQLPSQMFYGSLELIMPVYQNLWGPQMATKWIATAAIGTMF